MTGEAGCSFPLLADRETMALVSAAGAVEWLCAPRMDSPSPFTAILRRGAPGLRPGV